MKKPFISIDDVKDPVTVTAISYYNILLAQGSVLVDYSLTGAFLEVCRDYGTTANGGAFAYVNGQPVGQYFYAD